MKLIPLFNSLTYNFLSKSNCPTRKISVHFCKLWHSSNLIYFSLLLVKEGCYFGLIRPGTWTIIFFKEWKIERKHASFSLYKHILPAATANIWKGSKAESHDSVQNASSFPTRQIPFCLSENFSILGLFRCVDFNSHNSPIGMDGEEFWIYTS